MLFTLEFAVVARSIVRSSVCLRDVSGVELLMNYHQSVKAEIDSRDEKFSIAVNLGRDLLARKHYRSQEVRSDNLSRCLYNCMFIWCY